MTGVFRFAFEREVVEFVIKVGLKQSALGRGVTGNVLFVDGGLQVMGL